MSDDAWSLLNDFFNIFPWATLPRAPVGLDVGGEAAEALAPCVEHLHVYWPSATIEDESLDFACALEVLPKMPEPAQVICDVAAKLKPGAPMLIYLPYALDHRPLWFKALWQGSELMRKAVTSAPAPVRRVCSDAIAAGVYLPLSRASWALEGVGMNVEKIPLSPYRKQRFSAMRAGAAERFVATPPPRFKKWELAAMMAKAGLEVTEFLERPPFWTAVGRKRVEG